MSRTLQGYLFALAAAASFGTLAVSGKFAYADGVGVSSLMALRFAAAALGFLLVVIFRYRTQIPQMVRSVEAKQWLRIFFVGCGLLASEVTLFFMGLKAPGMTAGLAETIFFIYPAWVVLLGVGFFAHRLSPTLVICTLLAVLGVALNAGTFSSSSHSGVLYLLAASILYALYVVLSGRWINGIAPLLATTVMMCGTAFSLVLVGLIKKEPIPKTSTGWLAVGSAIFFGTFLAYAFMYAALHRVSAAVVAVLTTAEPVVALALGALVLGERMSNWQAVGSLLILGSVLTLLYGEYRAQRLESGR